MRILAVLAAILSVAVCPRVATAQPKLRPVVTEVVPEAQILSGQIRVRVAGLPQVASEADRVKELDTWVLYLDGQPVPGEHPDSVDLGTGDFFFTLRRETTSADAWKRAFSGVWTGRSVSVSLGPPTGGAAATPLPKDKFRLVLITRGRAAVGIIAFLCLVLVFVLVGFRSQMLRAPATPASGVEPPYSLARTQLAWWTLVVLGAYLFLGLATANWLDSFSATGLWLLGIAGATRVVSSTVDIHKHGDSDAAVLGARVQGLDDRITVLRQAAAAADASAAPTLAAQIQDAVTDRETAKADLAAATAALPVPSDGFFTDLITDRNGIAVHRLQALVWTAVLGVVFIGLTVRELAMPEFSDTILGLMGFSSGAYVALKVPEKS